MSGIFFQSAVLAYFDPGAGSIVLQSLIGGTAGILVFLHYACCRLFERFRRGRSN